VFEKKLYKRRKKARKNILLSYVHSISLQVSFF
jgi:hypothetical protein